MISVDSIYQKVLAISNKEQRGYITPQEFNLFANQAQLDIFEQYFYDLNQFITLPDNDTVYADMVTIIEDKIEIFQETADSGTIPTWDIYGDATNIVLPNDVYKVNRVEVENIEAEKLNTKEFNDVRGGGGLIMPSQSRPIYNIRNNILRINNNGNDFGGFIDPNDFDCEVFYIRKPKKVNWTYVVLNSKALYNSSAEDKEDFELHASEEVDLIFKILTLAGISMGANLYTIAATEDKRNIQQEKQ